MTRTLDYMSPSAKRQNKPVHITTPDDEAFTEMLAALKMAIELNGHPACEVSQYMASVIAKAEARQSLAAPSTEDTR